MIYDTIAAVGNGAILLSFSRGKDSLCMWLHLREIGAFRMIIPYYMHPIPVPAFIADSLRYYEDFFETAIIRVLDYSWLAKIAKHRFQPPERWNEIEDLRLPRDWKIQYDRLSDRIIAARNLAPGTWTAIGLKKNDSIIRRAMLTRNGGLDAAKRRVYPIADWNQAQQLAILERYGVKLPIDYRWFGRSYAGLDCRFLRVLREKAPDDFAMILAYWPLAELELLRDSWFGEGANDAAIRGACR